MTIEHTAPAAQPSRLRRHLTYWLIVGPAWVAGIAVAVVLVGIGASWTTDSWRATHDGIRGEFTSSGPQCGIKGCQWSHGSFRSFDGTHQAGDVMLWGLGGDGESPEATGARVSPVVLAPGGDTVYHPDDKTWMFAWLVAASGPVVCWGFVARASAARATVLRRRGVRTGSG